MSLPDASPHHTGVSGSFASALATFEAEVLDCIRRLEAVLRFAGSDLPAAAGEVGAVRWSGMSSAAFDLHLASLSAAGAALTVASSDAIDDYRVALTAAGSDL